MVTAMLKPPWQKSILCGKCGNAFTNCVGGWRFNRLIRYCVYRTQKSVRPTGGGKWDRVLPAHRAVLASALRQAYPPRCSTPECPARPISHQHQICAHSFWVSQANGDGQLSTY